MISISLIASALLVGCGGGSSTDTAVATAKTFAGSVVKGPIDNATIILRDAAGEEVARSISKLGKFELPQIDLNSDYYTIESMNGSYEDEATKQKVEVGNSGLKTLLSKAQLQDIMANGKFAAMTPETTVFAELVKDAIENKSKSLVEASTEAKETIKRVFIDGTSPLTMLPGDTFLNEGDLATDFPKDQTEAFARNRAISMSYMVRNLGLEPKEVFTIIQKIIEDLKPDGIINNSDLDNDGIDDNVTEDFGLARANLFQDTTSRLQRGELTDGQREELSLMGFDVDRFNGSLADAEASLDTEVKTYLTSTTLPTLHVLPTMTDEDGNATDAQATYTLTANTDVNVTIETPNGSWITPMWRYNNNPLPLVIRTNRGNAMTLNLDNKLDSNSTIHWHGFKIPAAMDGGPDTPVAAGSTKTYTFTMNQPAAPLWFHPHPDMETGKQVYMGLAGVYLLEDNITKTLEANNELPFGDKDTVLLVQDRRFDGNVTDSVRNLKYMDMEMDMDGMLGDTILVNGSVVPKQEVSNTLHRYRLYNVSNARNYKFALSDGSKFTVIGTDGGLLDTPTEVESITLGAAERVEIVIDFSKYNVGDKVMLVSQPFNGDMMGMMGGNMRGMNQKSGTRPRPGNDTASQDMNNSSQMTNDANMSMNSQNMNNSEGNMNRNGQNMDVGQDMNGTRQNNMGSMSGMVVNGAGLSIMRFDITSEEDETITLYTKLPEGAEIKTRHTAADTTNNAAERQFIMTMGGMGNMQNGGMQDGNGMSQGGGMQQMTFVINGKSFNPTRVDEFIEAGATEIWSIRNMSPMAHPFHAHAIQYQILSRNGVPATGTDLGWKDTFLVQPGETVKVIGKFEAINTGDYMYHCHILEHEDAGMMGYFRVGDTGVLGEQ
jgi:FtsP/CotA-like multicopper oxidase with cupredoxin domain